MPTIYAVYNTSTNEVVGGYEDTLEGELGPGFDTVEAPAEFEVGRYYLWVYDPGTSAVILKTGNDLKEAFKNDKRRLIKKYFNPDDVIETNGDIEGAVDVVVQILHHWVNGTTPTQQEKDNWNAFYAANEDHFRYDNTTALPQAIWDAMGTAKGEARTKETELKNDPEWVS